MDLINSRYSKRLQLDNFTTSRTANFYSSLIRKESAKTDIHKTTDKILPRLEPPQKAYFVRKVHLSTDMKDMKRSIQPQTTKDNSLRREKANLTRMGIGQEREQPQGERFAVCSRQGRRNYNEDRFVCRVRNSSIYDQRSIFAHKSEPYDLFAVFDGHGGPNCAEFLKEHFPLLLARSKNLDSNPELALRETFEKCEQKFLSLCEAKSGETSGSCAVVCLLVGGRIVVANLGDSRAVVMGGGSSLQLTRDHKPHQTGEKLRIIKHGGKIYREQQGSINHIKLFRQMRVLPGNLNVTRTIGDPEVKLRKLGGLPGMISAVPDIASHQKQHYQILLLGSDGLFQAFNSEEIRRIYEDVGREHQGERAERWLKTFVETLCEQAEGRSSDNITAIAVLLQ